MATAKKPAGKKIKPVDTSAPAAPAQGEESTRMTLAEAQAEDAKLAKKEKKPAAEKAPKEPKEPKAPKEPKEPKAPAYPKEGSKTGNVWRELDRLVTINPTMSRKELLVEIAKTGANPAMAASQYSSWRNFHIQNGNWKYIADQREAAKVAAAEKAKAEKATTKAAKSSPAPAEPAAPSEAA